MPTWGPGRTTLVVVLVATVVSNSPGFLMGSLAPAVALDMPLPAWIVGTVVATYGATAAIASTLAGRVARMLLSGRIAAGALAIAAAGLGAMAAAPSPVWLIVGAAFCGAGNGLSHPASNDMLRAGLSRQRQGLAFALKQSGVPFASVLAGLSLPVVALTVGWRWAFAGAAVIALGTMFWSLARDAGGVGAERAWRPESPRPVLDVRARRFFVTWAVTTGLGTGAASAVAAFTVTGGLGRGLGAGTAGIVLGAGSVICVLIRLAAGVLADRPRSVGFGAVVALLLVGAAGATLMLVPGPVGFVLGACLVLGPGWAWAGMSHYLVSKTAGPATPAATGIVQTGTFIGACLGPILAGLIMSDPAREWMLWGAAALAFAVAAACGAAASGRVGTSARRSRASASGTDPGTVAGDIHLVPGGTE